MARMDRVFHTDDSDRESAARAVGAALEAEPDIVFAYLHGSFLGTGGFRDVDVAVYLNGPEARHTARGVELATRLSSQVGFPVDVRPLNPAPISFRYHVFRGGRLLVSRDDELLADLIERTVRDYLDIAPLLRRSTAEAFGA